MADNDTGRIGFRCAVCGCEDFVPLARRSDGVQVVRCRRCEMGVIDPIPEDLMALYDDVYYGGPQTDGDSGRQGYTDYAYTAEHGVGWAAALVKLLRPEGGRILDIGCADGCLLAKLGPGYEVFGIEANETMGQVAAGRGIRLLG